MKRRIAPGLGVAMTLGILLTGLFAAPKPSRAMPPFAQAYGLQCSACHTLVPLLNAYGRYIQRTGYATLDRAVLARANPIWLGEAVNYDSTLGAGTGTPRTSFGNLAAHAVGYIAADTTFHAQQWITQGDQSGSLDTLWVTYNNLLHHNGHVFIGKILNPAPSIYGQNSDLDGPTASATLVGEHDWGATYNNRWGTRLAYVRGALDLEAGYYLSSLDLHGASYFDSGDKTFQYKVAYALPTRPYEFGIFGSVGSVPVSTNSLLDRYRSTAGYVQIDPGPHGRPGALAIYQSERDDNPGAGQDGLPLPPTSSRGASIEVFEPVLRGNMLVTLRHDFNDPGARQAVINGNIINVAFNIPHFEYAHGYLETALGGGSALAGLSGGPTWKGMLWLTVPITKVR